MSLLTHANLNMKIESAFGGFLYIQSNKGRDRSIICVGKILWENIFPFP